MNNKALTLETKIALARLDLHQEQSQHAMKKLEPLLDQLGTITFDTLIQPLLPYQDCYDILVSNQDERTSIVIRTGHELILNEADKIPDQRMRHTFRTKNPLHIWLQEL